MTVPAAIKITREEGYHTDQIGRYDSDKQFMGFVVATLKDYNKPGWETRKRWYSVLHYFEGNGRHIKSEIAFHGTTADGERNVCDKAMAEMKSKINGLNNVKYGDVYVRLFQVIYDDSIFGLVDASDQSEEYVSIHLLPNDLAFFDPWDGTYDT